MKPTPIFVKLEDFETWLFPLAAKLPKHYRQSLTLRLENKCLDLDDLLMCANGARGAKRKHGLDEADVALQQLRRRFRLCHLLKVISNGQYEHGARMLDEIGRLLGAWIKGSDPRARSGR